MSPKAQACWLQVYILPPNRLSTKETRAQGKTLLLTHIKVTDKDTRLSYGLQLLQNDSPF